MPYRDPEKHKQYHAAYRAKNRLLLREKNLFYYYKDRDKRLAYRRQYYLEHRAECDAESRLYAREHPEWSNGRVTRYRKQYPDKYRCRVAVRHAIESGRLSKEPCEVCGAAKTDAHHDDYNYPLVVRWLCRKHHIKHHRENGGGIRATEKLKPVEKVSYVGM